MNEITTEKGFTTYPYADISTGHVTYKDSNLVMRCGSRLLSVLGKTASGWFIYIPEDIEEHLKDLESLGFSREYQFVIKRLHEDGIRYARFDADGAANKNLPTCNW